MEFLLSQRMLLSSMQINPSSRKVPAERRELRPRRYPNPLLTLFLDSSEDERVFEFA